MATLKGLTLQKLVSDVCVRFVYICVRIDFMHMTVKEKGFTYMRSFEIKVLMTEFDCPEVTLCG